MEWIPISLTEKLKKCIYKERIYKGTVFIKAPRFREKPRQGPI